MGIFKKLCKHLFFDLLASPEKSEGEILFLGKTRPREIKGNCLRPHSKSVKKPEIGVKDTWPITLTSNYVPFHMGPPIRGNSSYSLMAG